MPDVPNILIGKGNNHAYLHPGYASRHGLIAGATGTGKTVTAQLLAENFAKIGVPVFITDVKGDVSGISQRGEPHPKVAERLKIIGTENFSFQSNHCVFWDLFADKGHTVRVTVSDFGPTLLSLLMDLNKTQQDIMNIVFRFADDEGLLLLDLKELRTTLKFIGDNAKQFRNDYGNISSASVGAIQRRLSALEEDGIDDIFGETQIDLQDVLRSTDGCGNINILAADKLVLKPGLYTTFLLWLLSEAYEDLPDAADHTKPKIVFFFEDAHVLFKQTPDPLLDKIATLVRLIRGKGVGIYFITQSPLDIPPQVLSLLGNHVQHALRAFTPKDKTAVKTTAGYLCRNPAVDAESAITDLGVGEALVSLIDNSGNPSMVERVLICPPASRTGPAHDSERKQALNNSALGQRYDQEIDRDSAHRKFKSRVQAMRFELPQNTDSLVTVSPKSHKTASEVLAKSVARSLGSQIGRPITRGILGGLFGGGRQRH